MAARLLCVVLAASLASGCSSVRHLPAGAARDAIRAGDSVRVVRRDGSVLEGFVVAVKEDGLVVEPDRRDQTRAATPASNLVVIPYSDIDRLDRFGFSPGKTAVAAGLVLAAVGYIALLIWLRDAWRGPDEAAGNAVPDAAR